MRADGSSGRLPLRHASLALRAGDVISCSLEPVGLRESVGALLARNAGRLGSHAVCCERRAGDFHPTTWRQLLNDACAMADYLSEHGTRPGDRVAVVSRNQAAMLSVEFATMGIGAVHVPVFAGYSSRQTSDLLAHAEPTVIIVQDTAILDGLRVPTSVRAVVSFAPHGGPHAQVAAFEEVLRRHAPSEHDQRVFVSAAEAVDPSAPCLMMYTSGTSGALKGVLLSHDNLLSQRRAVGALWCLSPQDRFLSYLPWHHSFGGIFEKYAALYSGATIYLDDSMGRDFPTLLRNWLEAQPTIYFSVPKIYQQLVAHAQAHPAAAARIFHPGLRFVFTAAAPLPATLSRYFAGRGIAVVEGWGLTETSPCCTLTDPGEARTVPGKVGYPIPGVSVRIAADGEILVRGPNVMIGYFKDEASTRAALPGDGWFHTGDLGELSGAGLRLVGRKDRVFKLLNAEKVVPTDIENRLAGMNPYIRHVIIAGAGRDFVAALIFPDYYRIAEEFGSDTATAERQVKASLRATLLEFNRTHPVKYEQVAAFAVVSKELSIEQGELTSSLKVRVHGVLTRAAPYLEAVYEPTPSCDCRYLRKVMRLNGDERRCFAGLDRTLAECHACGAFIHDDGDDAAVAGGVA